MWDCIFLFEFLLIGVVWVMLKLFDDRDDDKFCCICFLFLVIKFDMIGIFFVRFGVVGGWFNWMYVCFLYNLIFLCCNGIFFICCEVVIWLLIFFEILWREEDGCL